MPTLAHEGNPKEDEITITAGDVLSTASLDINLLVFGGEVPSSDPQPFNQSQSSCSDVFEWAGQNDGVQFMYLGDAPCFSSGASITRQFDTTLRLRINSTRTCYGVMWQEVYPLTIPDANPAAGSALQWSAVYNGVIDGYPRAGIALWIDDASTKNEATLFALVVDVEAGVTRLMQYDGQSLAGISNGTQRGTISALPSIGNILQLRIDQYPSDVGLSSNGVFASIYDSTGNTELYDADYFFEDDKPFDGTRVRHAKCNVGFVSIGGEQGGKLELTHSTNTTCHNGISPFMLLDSSGGS